jgi:hypothetical protein
MFAWDALNELDAYRITEIPRRPDADTAQPSAGQPSPGQAADPGRTQRLAALIAAYHADATGNGSGAVALGWVRDSAGGPVHVLAAGAGLVGSDDGQDVFLTLPGGARARPLPRAGLTGLMARLPSWCAIGGISDGLLPGEEHRPGGRLPASLEECLLAVWPGPFGWLLVAEPLSAGEIGQVADEFAERERQAAGIAERFPGKATEHRRLSLRHAEMRQGVSAGLWRVRLLAGGADAEAASRVAGLVCASADLDGLPYAVAPIRAGRGDRGGRVSPRGVRGDGCPREGRYQQNEMARGLRDVLEDPGPPGAGAAVSHPFYASTELVAALGRPPEREMPGVRLALRPDFDVTQESAGGRDALAVGEILDRNRRPAGPLVLPLDSLNRHVFVSGATGSGKSQTVRALLEAAAGAGIPWLVVEPAKAEYRLMAARLAGVGGERGGRLSP